MSVYRSGFAHDIEKFVAYRKASGSWNDYASGQNLRLFDHYCAGHYEDSSSLTVEMVGSWCQQRETETSSSCYTRTLVVREFVDYLRARSITDIVTPKPPKWERRKYIPYAFEKEELEAFFEACDSIIPYKGRPASIVRKIQCPVFIAVA